MSTAANHRKRSHRSEYKARLYNQAGRRVSAPTVRKRVNFNLISLIRRALVSRMARRTATPAATPKPDAKAP